MLIFWLKEQQQVLLLILMENMNLQLKSTDILVFSYIGYVTQEITVGSQSTINVTLMADYEQLSEVVVIGYGVRKKDDVTGSVSTVKGRRIN